MTDNFDAKSIGMRTQKKLLGKMATKKIAKIFIDDTSSRLLDNLYKLVRDYSQNKKVAEKIIKDLIKTVIKIGILYRNEQFSREELGIADQFRKKFRMVGMTVISFYEVDFSFDKNFLSKGFAECGALLKQLVQRHLTEKSLNRIDNVFSFFGDPTFLEAIFRADSAYRDTLSRVIKDLHLMVENNQLWLWPICLYSAWCVSVPGFLIDGLVQKRRNSSALVHWSYVSFAPTCWCYFCYTS